MNNISNVSNCVACGACINICPKKAIIMNTKGLFYYPEVNEDACTMCGLCLRHCPSNSNYKESNVISAFGCWYDDRKIVLNSSSGGAFYGMARHVIDDGGVVIGASFSSDFKAVEYHSTDEIPLECLQKSKYVESLIGNSFSSARAAIKMGRKVLFCGTPCHTAGLKIFLVKTMII